MSTRVVSRSLYDSLLLAGVAILLCLFTSVGPLRGPSQSLRVAFIQHLDGILSLPVDQWQSWRSHLLVSQARPSQIAQLEQENRMLFARLASCTQIVTTVKQSSASAKIATPVPEKTIPTFLSFSGGQWIILAGAIDGIHSDDIVLVDGVLIGKVSSVLQSYSTLELLKTLNTPLLVMHQESHTPGVLRSENGGLAVQFSKKITSLATDDLLVLVPDGIHARVPYPVARVETITSTDTDSVSTANVAALTDISIGQHVDVIQSSQP